jgi:hypothetical protein
MNVYCFHSLKELSLQTKFNLVTAILQGQVNLELCATGKQRGITTRWSGRLKDIGDDAKVICRRSAKPLDLKIEAKNNG